MVKARQRVKLEDRRGKERKLWGNILHDRPGRNQKGALIGTVEKPSGHSKRDHLLFFLAGVTRIT
jgi:hypothetical protein